MASEDPVIIVSARRTPVGAFQGIYSQTSATELGAAALLAALESSGLSGEKVDQVVMGCVLSAGLGQAPARQAALKAGLPVSVGCTTVNKVCGSGLHSIMVAHSMICGGQASVILAGGMENMTMAPYLLTQGRGGYRLGNAEILDHMTYDGLTDSYGERCSMGLFAENVAEKYHLTREAQDQFAIESGRRAQAAVKEGKFKEEIAPVEIQTRKEVLKVLEDEAPSRVIFEKIPTLKPVFKKGGTLTAANSSSINDAAAAVLLMKRSIAEKYKCAPLAVVRGMAHHALEPEWFTLAPIQAIRKLLQSVGWSLEETDLFEINEAFSVVPMAAMQELNLPCEKVNIRGGACALGHPIGASGTRILVTLLHALKTHRLKKGIASVCIGGGEGLALALEML